jgi:hypothetical protein
VITLPHQAQIHTKTFDYCDALQSTLHQPDDIDCLRGRFDHLPIRQLCYDIFQRKNSNEQDYFQAIQGIDNPSLLQEVDVMEMTPLHILCANPMSTVEMMKHLYNTIRIEIQQV